MNEEDTGKKKRVVVESLGWLTESSIMPKKHRAIAGVGPSSILELKAQLYKSQEEAKNVNSSKNPDQLEFHRAKKKITPHDPFAAKNSGVDGRSHKDKLEMKAVKDGSASYAALEKKAELYEKLARGEVSDEEDKEKYCVDFFSKKEELTQPNGPNMLFTGMSESVSERDDDDGGDVLHDTKAMGLGRATSTVDNDQHKRFVREVHEEANQAREKVSDIKVRRQEQMAVRREKLKQAYLKKQLEKLKAQSKQGNT
ncbi:hypothetical protein L2E82_30069 [Cichorium intybus]|uniref:Uncharacterized protein n=1 Tax=Cichorium intybus TaxID=13427 RepID=A0ACB9CZ71_CICIN|nr:hypothetical protein L2E82_30069 [Cichorium intybus]